MPLKCTIEQCKHNVSEFNECLTNPVIEVFKCNTCIMGRPVCLSFESRGEMKKETYKVEFDCWNCRHHFYVTIKKGTPAHGNGGECPSCGMVDGFNGKTHILDLTRE